MVRDHVGDLGGEDDLMSNPMIVCRNDKTGATAEIPKSALIHMTDWKPIAEGENPPPWTPEERARAITLLEAEKAGAPDDAAAKAEPEPDTSAEQQPIPDAPPAAESSTPARTTKSKAADTATNKEA